MQFRNQDAGRARAECEVFWRKIVTSALASRVNGAAPVANRPRAVETNCKGRFTLWRIGDAMASRTTTHAAVYDAPRLLNDI